MPVGDREHGNDLVEFIGLRLGLLDRCIGLFDERGIVLCHLVHGADGRRDLRDGQCLIAALPSYLRQQVEVSASTFNHCAEFACGGCDQLGTSRNFIGALFDEFLDFG